MAPTTTRFRILVPAHDEEKHIGTTLESLRSLHYPADLFEIHLVADNCGDDTARIGLDAGVDVHRRTDRELLGKGAALAWLIDRLPVGRADDVFVVIDADTIVDPGMLHAFERELARGPAAVQGYYAVRSAGVGGDVGFRAIALAVRHMVRPAGRVALGGSSSLYGNGMAFREDIARRYRWSNSLTEDLEMGLRLLLDGHMVGFAPNAKVEAEMPDSLAESTTQNERWEAGRHAVSSSFVPRLLNAARRREHGRRWAYLDAAIDISLPPLTLVGAATIASGGGMAIFSRGDVRRVGICAAAAATAMQALHVMQALRLADIPPSERRSLLRTPAHMLWKSRLVARVSRGTPTSWVRTSRGSKEAAA